MKLCKSLLMYMALTFGANAAFADMYGITDLRDGDMKKLVVHEQPVATTETTFTHEDGRETKLSDFEGKVVLVNFWATYCGPCRVEMPMLGDLQTELKGDEFEVVTVAVGRNSPPAIDRFFAEVEVDNLPRHTDPRMSFSRSMGVLALPVTLILDRDGQEIGRLVGEADWSSDSAKEILQTVIDNGAT